MDFGFASLLDKFEEHYGKRAGKVLVGLVGMAVVAVSLGLIWGFLSPIIGWVNGTVEGQSVWAFVARFFGFVSVLFLLWACGVAFSAILEAKNVMRLSGDIVDNAHISAEQAGQMLIAARAVVERLGKDLGGTGAAASEFDEIIRSVENAKTHLKRQSKMIGRVSGEKP